MNDKIDSLIAQLKTEIENYVQAEVAAQTGASGNLENPALENSNLSNNPPLEQENLALEPSAFTMPDFSAPASEVSSNEGSIGGKPMGESGIEATPVEVTVPPMPTPTSLDSSPSIPAPDFANSPDPLTINNPQENQNQNQTQDFQMPTFVNSETTNNPVATDAFSAPVTDLPLPGSENSSTNNVSVDEALSNLPDLNAFSNNQNDQVGQDNQTISTPASPSYDVSDVTPKDFTGDASASVSETSDLPQPNFPQETNNSGSADSNFSKAKGLLSRVLQKEWGKK